MSLLASAPPFDSPPTSPVGKKKKSTNAGGLNLNNIAPSPPTPAKSWEEKRYEKLPSTRTTSIRTTPKKSRADIVRERKERRRSRQRGAYKKAQFHDEDIEELDFMDELRSQSRLFSGGQRSSSPSSLSLDVERPPPIDVGVADNYLFSKRKPKSYDEALEDFVEKESTPRRSSSGRLAKSLPHRVMAVVSPTNHNNNNEEEDERDGIMKRIDSAVNVTGMSPREIWNNNKWIRFTGACLVVTIIVIGCIVYLVAGGSDSDASDIDNSTPRPSSMSRTPPPPRPEPPAPPEFNEDDHPSDPTAETLTSEAIQQLANSISNDPEAFENPNSPQSNALQWLQTDLQRDGAPSSDIRVKQRYVLATLYFALNGDGWTLNDDWLSNKHECTWERVGCGRDGSDSFPEPTIPDDEGLNDELEGEVFEQILSVLNLQENGLRGSIPSEIFALNDLAQLHMQKNRLTGSIPSSIFRMPRLHTLFLDENQLTGTIPASLGSKDSLRHVDLSSNRLRGTIPNSIGSLVELVDLRLNENQFTGEFPVGLIDLDNLSVITMGNNQILGTLPGAFGSLSKLVTVHMHGNELFGTIPHFVSKQLEHLHLDDNAFTGQIPEIAAITTLREIRVEGNEIGGSLPASLGDFSELELLWVQDNKLIGAVPSELGKLSQLTSLKLSNNDLTGDVSASICQLRDAQLESLEATCHGSNAALSCACCDTC